MYQLIKHNPNQVPWNKGKLVGQKLPLKLQEIWAIRVRLQIHGKRRDLALFNLAIDSKLRACDLLSLRVSDVANGGRVGSRAMIMQQKTARPVQFEITGPQRMSHVGSIRGIWIALHRRQHRSVQGGKSPSRRRTSR